MRVFISRQPSSDRSRLWTGASIQIDPTFPYYLNRSESSIAAELAAAGFGIVHYFVVSENRVNAKLIDALHAKGIIVWAMVLGNGTYSTDHLPKEWPSWRMKLLKDVNDGYCRLSPHSGSYMQWKKEALNRLVREYPFDGLEIAEPYFPEWSGLKSGVYGDIGINAQNSFKRLYGVEIPEFRDPSSTSYYLHDSERYRLWVQFRVNAVNGFLNEMFNGIGGVRQARPGIGVATWSLAVRGGTAAVEKLREEQGLESAAMIKEVSPDIHFLQTHWPDWMDPFLPAGYVEEYSPFFEEIRRFHPEIPIGVQTDIGSSKRMMRSRRWLDRFADSAGRSGYSTWTAYEYHLSKAIVAEKPRPVQAERFSSRGVVSISFNKRIRIPDGKRMDCVSCIVNGKRIPLRLNAVRIDGNLLELKSDHFPAESFIAELRYITDTPDLWFYPARKAKKAVRPCRIEVNAAKEKV